MKRYRLQDGKGLVHVSSVETIMFTLCQYHWSLPFGKFTVLDDHVLVTCLWCTAARLF